MQHQFWLTAMFNPGVGRVHSIEYGRWPNGRCVGRVPGALPLAMLR